jgi:hypothetical protein
MRELRGLVLVTGVTFFALSGGCGYNAIDASKVQNVQLRSGQTTLAVCGLGAEKLPDVHGGILALVDGTAVSLAKDGNLYSTTKSAKKAELGAVVDPNGAVKDKVLGVVHIDATGNITADKPPPRTHAKLHFTKPVPAAAKVTAGVLAGMAIYLAK